ncbi:MAG TPA: NIPSNAP family protein [Cellvibrionaceae bacterium]
MIIKALKYLGLALTLGIVAASVQAESETEQVFEMRTYTTHEGKLDDLNKRFANHTARLFERHGMRNIGYWVPTDPERSENTLIYILAHDSREAAQQSWQGFLNDPEWQEAYAKSRENGPIVKHIDSVFMTATQYSAIK